MELEEVCIVGPVERSLREKREVGEVLHFSLIDPHKTGGGEAEELGDNLAALGTDAFLVGGSLGVSPQRAFEVVESLKKTGLPVLIFPGDVSNVVPNADAILFLSLLNSINTYYIVGAQVQGALVVSQYGLEALPTAYLIIGYGGAAGFVGQARPIPWEADEIAAAYALAGRMMGMRFTYLEAGSGAPRNVSPSMVAKVRKAVPSNFIIVGGGLREPREAAKLAKSGPDAIVTGTIIEEEGEESLKRIIRAIKRPEDN